MDTLGERFETVLKVKGIKKTDAANKLCLSAPFITQICKGDANPSDRTIADICRVYGVNEHWLRTGMGEMFEEHSADNEIAEFTKSLLNYGSDSFRVRFISAISKLDENGWAVLEKIANDMAAESKKEPGE